MTPADRIGSPASDIGGDSRLRVELHLLRRFGPARYLRTAWDIAKFFRHLRREVRRQGAELRDQGTAIDQIIAAADRDRQDGLARHQEMTDIYVKSEASRGV